MADVSGLITSAQNYGCGQQPPVGVASRSAEVKFYTCVLNNALKGTYQGNQKAYKGMKWGDLYARLANSPQYQNTDPHALANTVLGIEAAQAVAVGIGATVTETGNAVNQIGKGAAAAGGQIYGSSGGGCGCLWTEPGVKVLGIGLGGGCFFTKTEARALIGGLLFVPAIVLGLAGVVVLAAYGLNHTGAGQAVQKSAKVAGSAAAFLV